MQYKAFISYSHAADNQLAPALQSALHEFAKPFYRLRAMRVFRDRTGLLLTPKLWPSIRQALTESEYFILLASPNAAASRWVQTEIDEWLSLNDNALEKFVIVLTDGTVSWNNSANDFDWNTTDALPVNLKRKFLQEPHYLDLRWAKEASNLSLRHPQFLDDVGTLAATLQGKPRDLMVGKDIQQHRIFKMVASTVAILLLGLFVVASGAAYYANEQRKDAERQKDEANKQRQSALEAVKKERTAAENERVARANEGEQRKRAESASENEKRARQQAEVRRRDAEWKSKIAVARQVAAQAQAQQRSGQYDYLLERSTLLAIESMRRYPTVDAQQVLHMGLTLIPPLVHTFRGDADMSASTLSPDAQYLATANRSGIKIYLLNSGRQFRFFETPYASQVRFSADSKYLSAVTDEDTVSIRDLKNNEEVARLKCGSRITVALMSPDSRHIAVGSQDGVTRVFEISGQREVARVEHRDPVTAIAFSLDGKYFATASSERRTAEKIGEIEIRQVETGRATTRIKTEGRIVAMTFTSGEEYLLTARAEVFHAPRDYSGTILGHTVQRWDVSTASEVEHKRYADSYLMTFSPDGRFIATGMKDQTFRVWNASRHEEVTRIENGATEVGLGDDGVRAVLFSGDGKYVAVVNGRRVAKVYDLQRETPANYESESTAITKDLRVSRVFGFSPDRKYLAVMDHDNTVQVIDASSHRRVGLYLHKIPVTAVAFSSNGLYLATASDTTIRIWRIDNGREDCANDTWGEG